MPEFNASTNLVLLRKRSGYTQKQVASLLSCSESRMYRFERGSVPDLKTALQFAVVYRAPVQTLFARLYRQARQQVGRKIKTLHDRRGLKSSWKNGHSNARPVLAIDPWTKAIGIAVLRGEELWHCGVRHLRKMPLPDRLLVKGRITIEELIRVHKPKMLVLPKMDLKSKRSPHVQAFCRAVRECAARGKLRVAEYSHTEVQQAMNVEGTFNRHRIAAAVAKRFPELASRLPPPRKFYKPQDLRVSAFYAVALALAVAQKPTLPTQRKRAAKLWA